MKGQNHSSGKGSETKVAARGRNHLEQGAAAVEIQPWVRGALPPAAIGETASFCCTPLSRLAGVSIAMERWCQQSGSPADGCCPPEHGRIKQGGDRSPQRLMNSVGRDFAAVDHLPESYSLAECERVNLCSPQRLVHSVGRETLLLIMITFRSGISG